MIKTQDNLFEGDRQPGLDELRLLLGELMGGGAAECRWLEQHRLPSRHPRVFRLRFVRNGKVRSLVVKRLEPAIAQRNELVIRWWLPAIGASASGPVVLGLAAGRRGQCC